MWAGARRSRVTCCPGPAREATSSPANTAAASVSRPDPALLERLVIAYWLDRAAAAAERPRRALGGPGVDRRKRAGGGARGGHRLPGVGSGARWPPQSSGSRPVLNRLMKVHTVAYRATGGHIGHRFPGQPPHLLLDHVGARSGTKRTSALSYIRDGDDVVIVASKGGHPKNPSWFHNLRANPDTTIQVGSKHVDVHARVAGSRGAEAAVAEGRRRVQRLRGLPEADRAGDPARGPRTAGGAARGSAMQRLSSQDASFLHLEDAVSHMHIGSVAIFEGPPPAYEELVERWCGRKLPLVPRYRQRVRFVPLALGRPVWVDDPHFNLGYHLRRTALPAPGGDDELRKLVGRLMSQQLDRSQAAVGDLDGRGPERGPLGAALQGAPLHGRRRLRDGAALGDPRRRARAGARPRRTTGTRAAAARARAGRHGAGGAGAQPLRAACASALCARRARPPSTAAETARGLLAMGGVVQPHAAVVAQRADRPAPALGLGALRARRREEDPPRARRHGQRRGAGRDHRRLPRAAASPAASPIDRDGAHAGAGVGPPPGEHGHVQQPRLGDVRRAARGDRGSGRAAAVDPRADGAPQGVAAGGGGRRADVAERLRPARCCWRSASGWRRGCRSAT